jgi:hypothetical protein
MRAYYGSKISENMTITPDGFLLCLNVPIARTGWYEYLPQEIGVQGDGIVKVYRSPQEVFSKKAIASFEGKIVTDNHPPTLLTPENSELYIKGAVQNVRQSKDELDLLIADLIIYNKTLIDEITKQVKREVSCGYEYECISNGDGTYSQINIVGNHVAVVDNGRAGDRVAIMDSYMEGEKKKMKKKKIKLLNGPITNTLTALGFKHFAADAEPDEIAETIDALAEERQCEDEDAPGKKENETTQTSEDECSDPEVAALTEKVDKLTELVTQLVTKKAEDEEKKPEDAIDEMISELSNGENSTGDEEESVTIPVEEMDEDIPDGVVTDPEDRPENPIPGADSAAMIRALKAMKPVIAKIKDPVQRKVACDSLIKEFKKAKKPTQKGNGYSQILTAQRKNATSRQKASDSREKTCTNIEDNYKKMNSHYKGDR